MPGLVLEVLVQVGEQVVEGQALLKLEAMKMEHTIRAGQMVWCVRFIRPCVI